MRFVPEVDTKGKINIDAKDRKILANLALNSRLPASQIAKTVALSRDAVSYRIELYQRQGLIQGYKTIVNISKLGFMNFHVFLQLNKPAKKDEEHLLQQLKQLPFMRAILKFSGKYDLELAIIARSIQQFELYLEGVIFICSRYLLDYEILIITKDYRTGSFPLSFLDAAEQEYEPKKKEKEYRLDDQDFAILNILADQARLPIHTIAQQVKLSADAITYRMKRMIESHYITRFVPAINYSLLGYSIYAVLMDIRSFGETQEALLKQFFNTDRNIMWAVKTIGKYNILFYINSRTQTEVHETILNLRNHFPEKIRAYETLPAYEQYKYTYLPRIVFEE